jgi:hypothetical protein
MSLLASLSGLCDDAMTVVCLCLSKDAELTKRSLSKVNRALRDQLATEAFGRSLCISAWRVDDTRRESEWPALSSWWALYRVLFKFAPLEGFYSLAHAYPWGVLVLLRFHHGC